MAHTNAWDETSPTDATLATSIDDEIRKVRKDIRERMAVDHNLAASDDGSGDEGLHKKVTFEDKIAAPSLSANQSVLYVKTADLDGELRYKDKRGLDSLMAFVGEVRMRLGLTVPDGWLALNGNSIGNVASGATHAGTDYEGLYCFLWDELADAEFAITGGRGGSAAADWAALKPGTMPDARGRVPVCAGTGSGLTARTIGDDSLGGEELDLAHTHAVGSYTVPTHLHQWYNFSVYGAHDQTYDVAGAPVTLPITTKQKGGYRYIAVSVTQTDSDAANCLNEGHVSVVSAHLITGTSASALADDTVIMNPFIVFTYVIRY